jgi:ADP-ribose pyrophosphatase YjhB (NUDIX family)
MPASPDRKAPTHAGGVVYRITNSGPEFLLVTARRQPDEWVLPKGHIERGERPEDTAVREVTEETGVHALVERPLSIVVIHARGEEQRIQFFLMRALRDGAAHEGRRRLWLTRDEAVARLPFEDSRRLLRTAADLLGQNGV